jgi:hypothetical protein
MTSPAAVRFAGYNPDVLNCIANLSNDEVFTPPDLANRMLDTLAEAWAASNNGASIWADSKVTFLDPCTKTGVFLREITTRLIDGLADEIPDLQTRVDHILTKQVFGIAITRLTGLIARRTLYCSKYANGSHSAVKSFDSPDGNIWFERMEHTWEKGRCVFCGAGQSKLDRSETSESHAYAFIHTSAIRTLVESLFGKDMQFDVVVGNPPYQLEDGGFGASAVPIYNKFVDQAKLLNPRFLCMVVPARWFFGGRGLDEFRHSMLSDSRLRKLIDYPDSRTVFQGVDIAGGICYFLWNRDSPGDCEVVSHRLPESPTVAVRPLLEPGADVFIRSNEAISILHKIGMVEAGHPTTVLPPRRRFDRQVSSQKPFGLRTYFRGTETRVRPNDVLVLQSGGRGYAPRESITVGADQIGKWKVFTSKSSSEHAGQVDKNGMRRVLSLSGLLPPGSVVTETYIILGSFDAEIDAKNCLSYVCTKFFRFLVATRSSAQDLARAAYSFVPLQDFSESWSDGRLYKKYALTEAEIRFIESTIRPLEITFDANAD